MPTTAPAPRRAIVHLAAECFPYARTGGLAEAVHGLAAAQAAAGEKVQVVMPLHQSVRSTGRVAPEGTLIDVTIGERREQGRYCRIDTASSPAIWAVEHEGYFARNGIYGDAAGDYPDNPMRFAFFCRAALTAIATAETGPIILHLHDWHTALAALYLRVLPVHAELAARTRVVLSVHNPGYQGHYSPDILPELGIPWSEFDWRHLEWYGRANILKGGLTYADQVTTVSPSQAAELLTPDGGFGLHDVFRNLGGRFSGIRNGIDQLAWDASRDPQIAARYDRDDPSGKRACKQDAQRRFGLPERPDVPVFGFAGRLVTQKGLALMLEAQELYEHDAQFLFLGRGDAHFVEGLAALAKARPDRVALHHGFRDDLEHVLIAGADALLMPSQYEPCGLTQMRAQRYGTLPLVRHVGGLADTVADGKTGFVFDDFSVPAFSEGVSRVLVQWQQPSGWQQMMRQAMQQDFSWSHPRAQYFRAYDVATDAAAD